TMMAQSGLAHEGELAFAGPDLGRPTGADVEHPRTFQTLAAQPGRALGTFGLPGGHGKAPGAARMGRTGQRQSQGPLLVDDMLGRGRGPTMTDQPRQLARAWRAMAD